MAAEHYGYDEDDFPMTPGEAYRAGVMNEVLKICLNYGAVVSVLRLEQRHNCVQGATRLCQYTIRQKVISGPTPTERSACNILLQVSPWGVPSLCVYANCAVVMALV